MIYDPGNSPVEFVVEDYLLRNKRKQHELQEKICAGNLKDFAEYKFYTGELRGMYKSDDEMRSAYASLVEVIERDVKDREVYDKEQKSN